MTLVACGSGERVYSNSHAHANSHPRTNGLGDCEQHENRHAKLAMSTSFQPAEWDYQFFTNHPTALCRWEI